MVRSVGNDEIRRIETLISNTLLLSNTGNYRIDEVSSLVKTYSENSVAAMTRSSFARVHLTRDRIDGFVCLEGETLQALFVAPDMQGRGIGRALVGVAEEFVSAHGHEHLRVPASLTAADFYEHLGFVRQGPGRTTGGVRIVWMIKPVGSRTY